MGELAALDGAGRAANAFAVTAVEVVAVSTPEFLRLVTEHDGAALALAELLGARLRTAAQRCVELSTADAVARVCSRLDELASRYGRTNASGQLVIDSPITQAELAQWAGLSREAVVKSLRSLRRVGWLDVCDGTFVVRDRDALRARAML
jgi:CRP/FNR family cyclic AMP-dependent transcriptional regulator